MPTDRGGGPGSTPRTARATPFGDFGVVARLQDGGDLLPSHSAGRVLRVFQQTVGKAFLFGRGRVAKDAGDQPDGGIRKRLHRDFAAGQDKIAKADLFDLMMVKNALVDTLEPATQQGDPSLPARRRAEA